MVCYPGSPLFFTNSSLSAKGITSSARLCRMTVPGFTALAGPLHFHGAMPDDLTQAMDNLESRIMCGYGVNGVRFWHSADHFTLVSGQNLNQAFSQKCRNSCPKMQE